MERITNGKLELAEPKAERAWNRLLETKRAKAFRAEAKAERAEVKLAEATASGLDECETWDLRQRFQSQYDPYALRMEQAVCRLMLAERRVEMHKALDRELDNDTDSDTEESAETECVRESRSAFRSAIKAFDSAAFGTTESRQKGKNEDELFLAEWDKDDEKEKAKRRKWDEEIEEKAKRNKTTTDNTCTSPTDNTCTSPNEKDEG